MSKKNFYSKPWNISLGGVKFHFLKGIEREGESEIEREKNERVRARLQCFAERKWELEWVLLHNAVEGKLELEGTKAYTCVSILGISYIFKLNYLNKTLNMQSRNTQNT